MKQVFPIVAASGGAAGVLIPVAALLIALLVLFGYIAYSTRHVKFEISPEGLRITGDLYGRMIPARELVVDHARALNLATERDYRLATRTNGIGLPGYSAGWFRLANGDKALAFVTDRTRVVYVPTRQGYAVLLSVTDPQEFLHALSGALSGRTS